jgi:hypothetical protein
MQVLFRTQAGLSLTITAPNPSSTAYGNKADDKVVQENTSLLEVSKDSSATTKMSSAAGGLFLCLLISCCCSQAY